MRKYRYYANLILPALIERGVSVRCLVRDDCKAVQAMQQGADDTVIGNLEDAESLARAANGVDGVFHINPAFHPREAQIGVSMVNAAKSAGVRKFVFSGVIHPSVSRINNHAAKQAVDLVAR